MASPQEPAFIQTLRQYFQLIQRRGGDHALRVTLSADRKVTALASRMNEMDKVPGWQPWT
jgi:uncharacterized protein (DUF934 family)